MGTRQRWLRSPLRRQPSSSPPNPILPQPPSSRCAVYSSTAATQACRLRCPRCGRRIDAATDRPAVHVGEQERILTEVALATAEAGDLGRAERLAGEIISPHARVVALTQLARQAPRPHARRLLARALTDELVEPSLKLLALHQPDVLPTVAHLLLDQVPQAAEDTKPD